MSKIQFRATIPEIMSAIKTGSDGMRLTLDIPELDVEKAAGLIALRKTALKITVEVDNGKAAIQKGPWGIYWQKMFAKGFFLYDQPLKDTYRAYNAVDMKNALKEHFEQSSLTSISPSEFDHFCKECGFTDALAISKEAQAEMI